MKNSSGSDSLDTTVIIDDKPGDSTVRPLRPVLRQRVLAEREALRKWQESQQSSVPPQADVREIS